MRVVIDERAFRKLVARKVVTLRGVDISLADIGWKAMAEALLDAVEERLHPPDPPEAREFLARRTRRP